MAKIIQIELPNETSDDEVDRLFKMACSAVAEVTRKPGRFSLTQQAQASVRVGTIYTSL